MLTGHTIGLHERTESDELLLENPVAEIDDEEAEISGKVLYRASFEEFARSHVQCDTIIWVLISLLLVLAWGVGIVMLIYLPFRRHVLLKDISSRKLYITPNEIVYKARRPSFVPFLGFAQTVKHIPLHKVVDIIMEQGCLQSLYGIHTFRIESIAYGRTTPVDELQLHGVSNPKFLRKIIVTEAAKRILEFRTRKPGSFTGEGGFMPAHMSTLAEVPTLSRMQAPTGKVQASPSTGISEAGGTIPSGLLLHKLEEVEQSVKRIEYLFGESQGRA